jgi:hypothetical protein
MEFTKQRKIIVAVLALALLALFADRLFLGGGSTGPQPTAAHTPPSAPPPARAPVLPAVPAGAASAAAAATGESLADRLRKLAEKEDIEITAVRDAFAPSVGWIPKRVAPEPTAQPAEEKPDFAKQHELMAVMAGALVIVDGKCLRVGAALDGYVLVSVGNSSAVFQSDGDRVELRLKDARAEGLQ